MKKMFVLLIVLVCLFNFLMLGAAAESSFFEGLKATAEQGAGYQPIAKSKAGEFISVLLGKGIAPVMVGVMGMLLLAYGGFIWMMSRGNEQELERAKTIINNTLIAMIVIFSAWAIVQLIIPLWECVTTGKACFPALGPKLP